MRFPGETILKICGVSNDDDGVFAADSGADIIGVILDQTVVRHGNADLISRLHSMGIRTAGVYTSLDSALSEYRDEDLIQLHFDHDAETVRTVKERTGKEVISVIQFRNTEGIGYEAIRRYQAGADIVLLENRSGIVNYIPQMQRIQKRVRTGLAGKISPANVRSLSAMNPLMIDVSSSLEEYPGKKDHTIIRELFRNLEAA